MFASGFVSEPSHVGVKNHLVVVGRERHGDVGVGVAHQVGAWRNVGVIDPAKRKTPAPSVGAEFAKQGFALKDEIVCAGLSRAGGCARASCDFEVACNVASRQNPKLMAGFVAARPTLQLATFRIG